jgi:hypothetical protein
MYFAFCYKDKHFRKLLDWCAAQDRDDAALTIFSRNPKVETVTTTCAHAPQNGRWEHVYIVNGVAWASNSVDIRWLQRRDVAHLL